MELRQCRFSSDHSKGWHLSFLTLGNGKFSHLVKSRNVPVSFQPPAHSGSCHFTGTTHVPLFSAVKTWVKHLCDWMLPGAGQCQFWSILKQGNRWKKLRGDFKVLILDKYLSYTAAISSAGNCSLSIICCIWQGHDSGLLQKIAWLISGEQHIHTIIKEKIHC